MLSVLVGLVGLVVQVVLVLHEELRAPRKLVKAELVAPLELVAQAEMVAMEHLAWRLIISWFQVPHQL